MAKVQELLLPLIVYAIAGNLFGLLNKHPLQTAESLSLISINESDKWRLTFAQVGGCGSGRQPSNSEWRPNANLNGALSIGRRWLIVCSN